MKRIYLLLSLSLLLTNSCTSQRKDHPEVKNIIIMIGDGMGLAQVFAAYTANHGKLNLEKCSHIGLSKTSSASDYITDSGAGGTAISTGAKTKNYSVGVDVSGNPLKSILRIAEANGLATGLVATSSITHATPASFISSQKSRGDEHEIAADFINSGIDIFIGGGKAFFEGGKINVTDSLRKRGYNIVYTLEEITPAVTTSIGCLAADTALPSVKDGRKDFLPRATEIAIKKLSGNNKGFFLMVEGSQIDWGGHANDIEYVIGETLDFDEAVGKAFAFADNNPGTLVIVTADHETGGLTITDGDISKGVVEAHFSSQNHTPVMVPVYAYGTGAEEFSGIYENTELFEKMLRLYRFRK